MSTPIVALLIPDIPTILLREGCSILVGRSSDAEIQIVNPTISRKHAHIKWISSDYPIITDNQSTAGLKVDDQYVSHKHLHGEHTIVLGNYPIQACYYADKVELPYRLRSGGIKVFPRLNTDYEKENFFLDANSPTNALLEDIDESDGVVLFTSYRKADERGRLSSKQTVKDLLSHIENKQYTGTLTLTTDLTAKLVFAAGKIIQAHCGHLRDMRAVEYVSDWKQANYHFSYSVDVCEARLDVRPTQYFKKLETTRFTKSRISQRLNVTNDTTLDTHKRT